MKKRLQISSARRPDPAGILLVGYFGFANLGDELLLKACVRNLRPLRVPILVLSGPVPGARSQGVKFVSRWNWLKLLSLLATPGLAVVFPGGEIFQSVSSRRSLHYYSFVCRLFSFFGHRLFLVFQGVPENSLGLSERRSIIAVFRSAAYVSFRDSIPAFLSRSLPRPVGPLPDPVFGLSAVLRRTGAGSGDAGSGDAGLVFVLKDLKDGGACWEKAVADLIRTVLKARPSSKIRLAVFHPDDMDLNRRVVRQIVSNDDGSGIAGTASGRLKVVKADIKNMGRIFGRSDFVFAMRYHALVLAVCAGARAFVLTDEEKLVGLCRFLGHKYLLDLRTVSSPAGIRRTILMSVGAAINRKSLSRAPAASLRRDVGAHWAEVRNRLGGYP